MDYIKEIEKMREELVRIVNCRCDELILQYQNESMDLEPFITERELAWSSPAIFKGKKPVAVKFASGEIIEAATWKKLVLTILQHCNQQPVMHERLMQLRDKAAGRQRIILGSSAERMDVPLKIDEGLYFEGKFDTEALLTMSTKKVLEPVGYDYNFKSSFREFANMWRVFALNDEQGTVICDYPEESRRPALPLPYSDECMTGFEYAFAGLLISEGFIEEGLNVVRAIRNRYDGQKRNPWNEIECGSNYARAMASFSLLPIFSGLEFDLPRKHIGFSPLLSGKFKCLWSLGTGWGDFTYTGSVYKIVIVDGNLELESVKIENCPLIKKVYVDGKEIIYQQTGNIILFKSIIVKKQIQFEL